MAIVPASIVEMGTVLDVPTAVNRCMFVKMSKYTLWDLATSATKNKDRNTAQLLYDGEERGQTQRFMITAGNLIEDLFNFIDNLFFVQDAHATETNMLQYIQDHFGAMFVSDLNNNGALIREVLAEIIPSWTYKGTKGFLHWIIWKAFGWQLTDIISNLTNVIFYNLPGHLTYNPGGPTPRVIYNDAITWWATLKLFIDVFYDPDFELKRVVLESLIKRWTLPAIFSYIHTP